MSLGSKNQHGAQGWQNVSNSGGAQHNCASKKWGAREASFTNFQKKWGGQGTPDPPGSATPGKKKTFI